MVLPSNNSGFSLVVPRSEKGRMEFFDRTRAGSFVYQNWQFKKIIQSFFFKIYRHSLWNSTKYIFIIPENSFRGALFRNISRHLRSNSFSSHPKSFLHLRNNYCHHLLLSIMVWILILPFDERRKLKNRQCLVSKNLKLRTWKQNLKRLKLIILYDKDY